MSSQGVERTKHTRRNKKVGQGKGRRIETQRPTEDTRAGMAPHKGGTDGTIAETRDPEEQKGATLSIGRYRIPTNTRHPYLVPTRHAGHGRQGSGRGS